MAKINDGQAKTRLDEAVAQASKAQNEAYDKVKVDKPLSSMTVAELSAVAESLGYTPGGLLNRLTKDKAPATAAA